MGEVAGTVHDSVGSIGVGDEEAGGELFDLDGAAAFLLDKSGQGVILLAASLWASLRVTTSSEVLLSAGAAVSAEEPPLDAGAGSVAALPPQPVSRMMKATIAPKPADSVGVARPVYIALSTMKMSAESMMPEAVRP